MGFAAWQAAERGGAARPGYSAAMAHNERACQHAQLPSPPAPSQPFWRQRRPVLGPGRPPRVGLALALATAALGAVLAGCQAGDPLARQRPITLTAHGHTVTLAPAIDRLIAFGPEAGPSLLHVRDLDRPVATDPADPAFESYVFRGGCYTWISPQSAWVGRDGARSDWPPDPAMDRGPVRIIERTPASLTTRTPLTRLGLVEHKTFTLTPEGGELSYALINPGDAPIEAAAWINTAVARRDRIALYMPEGTTLRGWDDVSVARLESILSPPTAHGWRLVELHRASWQGGIKVWVDTPARDATIGVWREGRWLVRTLAPLDAPHAQRVPSEVPVAVYIDPADELIEAELIAPATRILPGQAVEATERWSVLPGVFPHPSADDLAWTRARAH
jgi:hypothetical protein